MIKAYWSEGAQRSISNEVQLNAVIAEVQNLQEPTMLFLERDDGGVLVVGLGSHETVLTFVDSNGSSFHSVGNPQRAGVLKFWCRDQLDDFHAQMAIPTSLGLDAAKLFVRAGSQPQNVTWEADW